MKKNYTYPSEPSNLENDEFFGPIIETLGDNNNPADSEILRKAPNKRPNYKLRRATAVGLAGLLAVGGYFGVKKTTESMSEPAETEAACQVRLDDGTVWGEASKLPGNTSKNVDDLLGVEDNDTIDLGKTQVGQEIYASENMCGEFEKNGVDVKWLAEKAQG